MDATPQNDFQTDVVAIRSDIAALTESIAKLTNEASKAQVAMTKTVRKAAKASAGIGAKMWDQTADLGHDTTEAMQDAARAGMSSLEKRIRQSPVNSVLIALGIGFVVCLVGLTRRK